MRNPLQPINNKLPINASLIIKLQNQKKSMIQTDLFVVAYRLNPDYHTPTDETAIPMVRTFPTHLLMTKFIRRLESKAHPEREKVYQSDFPASHYEYTVTKVEINNYSEKFLCT